MTTTPTTPSTTLPASVRAPRGFVLLEALIALLIFSLAVLGLVGLQASMTRATSGAKYRADAAYLASDLVGLMWTDSRNLTHYDADTCDQHAPCLNWRQRVRERLPAGTGSASVSTTAPGQVTVRVTWQAASDDVRHFETTTAINQNPSQP